MDNREYLKQISASVRPEKAKKTSFLSSNIFKIIIGAIAAFIVVIIIGNILSSGKDSLRNNSFALKLHLDNTLETISEYQKSIKSSDLRSSSASLYSILSNTNRDLTSYITEKWNYKEKSVNKNILEEEKLESDDLNQELFEAKINGILDRIYAHKMAYEISLITTRETSLSKGTKDEAFKSLLNSSLTSLNNLYDKFNDFSETK